MLSLQFEEFMLELKDGSIKNIGASNKQATAKLYDIVESEAREFGDERVKLAFTDEDDNVIEVALDPSDASAIASEIESLEESSQVFE